MTRHLLTIDELSGDELAAVLDDADALKADPQPRADLRGMSVGLIFERPSTRTRVSFEVGVAELGGTPVVLRPDDLQLGRGESLEDTGRALSGYLHALVVRTTSQSRLETLASAASVPVINALSDVAHPCEAIADLMTIREYKGDLAGIRLAYLGDGNNVASSLVQAGAMAGMEVRLACPPGYEPIPQVMENAVRLAASSGGQVSMTTDPLEAAKDADAVYTDVWASMGQESEEQPRELIFRPFQVNAEVMAAARPDAVVMHCLPAHRGEEITAEVLDGQQSVVWAQSENNLHVQKALLRFLIGGKHEC